MFSPPLVKNSLSNSGQRLRVSELPDTLPVRHPEASTPCQCLPPAIVATQDFSPSPPIMSLPRFCQSSRGRNPKSTKNGGALGGEIFGEMYTFGFQNAQNCVLWGVKKSSLIFHSPWQAIVIHRWAARFVPCPTSSPLPPFCWDAV